MVLSSDGAGIRSISPSIVVLIGWTARSFVISPSTGIGEEVRINERNQVHFCIPSLSSSPYLITE